MLVRILPTFQQLFNDFTIINILYQLKHIYTKTALFYAKHFSVLQISSFQIEYLIIYFTKDKCNSARLQSHSQLFNCHIYFIVISSNSTGHFLIPIIRLINILFKHKQV
jgi:hypothetical protein